MNFVGNNHCPRLFVHTAHIEDNNVVLFKSEYEYGKLQSRAVIVDVIKFVSSYHVTIRHMWRSMDILQIAMLPSRTIQAVVVVIYYGKIDAM